MNENLNIIGIDQSLSNVGVFNLNVENNYINDLKTYIELLFSFIETLNVKPGSYLAINKKSKNVSFDLLEEIKKGKYTKIEKVCLEDLLKKLINLQNSFSEKYSNYKEIFDLIITQKNISENQLFNSIQYNCYLINSIHKNMKRLCDYKESYKKIIDNKKPDLVALEGYSYGSKATRSLFELGELAGVLKLTNYENNILTVVVSPSSLKKFMTGKGNSDKYVVKEQMINTFGIKFNNKKDDDLYDSLGLSYFLLLLPFFTISEQMKIKVIKN